MQGGVRGHLPFDARSTPLVADAGVLDATIDWRKRKFRVEAVSLVTAADFAWKPGAPPGATLPQAGGGSVVSRQFGQSFEDDSAAVLGVSSRNAGVVFFANQSVMSTIASGSNAIGLYVDLSTGALKLYYLGTPGILLDFWIEATGPFDNV
jgi:hypothetical protein